MSKRQNLHNRVLTLEAENARLKAKLAASSTATGMIMVYDELDNLTLDNRSYQATVENLRSEKARLEDQLANATGTVARLKEELELLDDGLVIAHMDGHHRATASARATVDKLKAENDRLREALRFYSEGEWNDNYPGGVRVGDSEYAIDKGGLAIRTLKEK